MARHPRQPCPYCGRSITVRFRMTRAGITLMHRHVCRSEQREAFPVPVLR